MNNGSQLAMKIKIEDIPSEGLHRDTVYDPWKLDMEVCDSPYLLPVKFVTSITASIDFRLIEKQLFIEAVTACRLRTICSRCLEEFELSFEKEHHFDYNTRDLEFVDITPGIRGDIIMEYPVKPLCKKDCEGICPGCGMNLNIESCRCENK